MLNLINPKGGVLVCFLYGALGLLSEVQASRLMVKNNVSAPVEVIIQHDSESGLMATDTPLDSPEIKDIIGAGKQKTYEITKKETSYSKKFSIIGKVNFYSLSDRCSDLEVNKDYNIILNPKENGGVVCSYTLIEASADKPAKVRKR